MYYTQALQPASLRRIASVNCPRVLLLSGRFKSPTCNSLAKCLRVWAPLALRALDPGSHCKGVKTMPPTVALLVIAHPDDECMFFGPLLLASQGTYQWKVLCLSTGADAIVNDMQVADSQHRL